MKPVIAITVESRRDGDDARTGGGVSLNWNYAEAIARAGGVPVVVPPVADMREVARFADGWLLPGGDDLDSSLWGEPLHPKASLQDGTRFAAERALFDALPPEAPIFGICYGAQAINVLYGGALHQHLPDVVGHEGHAGGTMQEYRITGEGRLSDAAQGDRMRGKSFHHQAISRLGRGLRSVAVADDGTIEAVEATDRPWLVGVQWHPERTPDDPATRRLFGAFVAAAQKR